MKRLVLLRHGESTWNRENRFTGWTDVGLSRKGVREATEAGRLLLQEGFTFDVAYTSMLKRAIKTLWLVLEEMDLMWIPVHRSWRFNERHYGALQGLDKAETAEHHGLDQTQLWRRSYDIPPPALMADDPRHPSHEPRYAGLRAEELPLTECLKDTVERVLPYWHETIVPAVGAGQRVIIAAHGNSLRALVKYLDGMSDEQTVGLNIPTGIPLVYELEDDLTRIRSFYLGDPDAIKRATQAVAGALQRKRQKKAVAAARVAEVVTKPITRERFDAVLFDLDGVLTDTASVHAMCWKKMFDDFLKRRAVERKEPFFSFDIGSDYRLYVDGKPRYDGVRSFLASRDVELAEGSPDSPPDEDTVYGLGNRKNQLFNEVVESDGVKTYEGSVALVRHLRGEGIKTAIVSSSRNSEGILRAAGIVDLFELRVDGLDAAWLNLRGKPAPDTFLEAARQLGVEPQRSVVVEDALSGVQAGRDGGFGLVIGVDRHGARDALKQHGAHLVVSDLGELL